MNERAGRLADLEFLRQVVEQARVGAPVPAPAAKTLFREMLLEQIGHIYHDTVKLICASLAIEKPERKKDKTSYVPQTNWNDLLRKYLADKSEDYCYGVLVAESAYREKGWHGNTRRICKALGISFNEIKEGQLQTLKDQAKEKEAKKAKKTPAKTKAAAA